MTSFLFPLKEIRKHAGTDDLVGTRLIARALVKVKLEKCGAKSMFDIPYKFPYRQG